MYLLQDQLKIVLFTQLERTLGITKIKQLTKYHCASAKYFIFFRFYIFPILYQLSRLVLS
jgi:hypothetical protein